MRICKTCVLPETYPRISFDDNGVCNFCREGVHHDGSLIKKKEVSGGQFINEDEVMKSLQKFKNPEGTYDLLVSASGGIDSSFALIQLVEQYKLNPLVWHNDHGFEHEVATENAKKLCKALDVDLIIWQHDFRFMRKMWKFVMESDIPGANCCFVCANILYWNALELANKYNLKLVVNGYSKGQIGLDKERGRTVLKEMINAMLKTEETELFETFVKKYGIINHHIGYQKPEDIETALNSDKILVLPFFVFEFYKTQKKELKEICRQRFDWQQMPEGYPARTTNCKMNWLSTYVDLKKVNYSIYTDEYAGLVREGEMSREQALEDLNFNPPEGLIEHLAKEVNLELDKIVCQV